MMSSQIYIAIPHPSSMLLQFWRFWKKKPDYLAATPKCSNKLCTRIDRDRFFDRDRDRERSKVPGPGIYRDRE